MQIELFILHMHDVVTSAKQTKHMYSVYKSVYQNPTEDLSLDFNHFAYSKFETLRCIFCHSASTHIGSDYQVILLLHSP